MAKKQGAGIAAKAPKPRPTHQQNKKQKQKAAKGQQLPGLTDGQNQLIDQTQGFDFRLGGAAGGMLPSIEDAYSQPFDYGQLPESPWSQGQTIEDMNTEYYDKALSNYDRSMQDKYKQEDADFEQQMLNRGIPLGSNLYNKMKGETQKNRDLARQNAMDSAYFNAGQNATTWNNLGTQNFQNAYGFAQDQRNQPLTDYTRLMAAQSGMPLQNLGYSQAFSLQNDAQAHDQWMMKNTPRGGGGGGAAPPSWVQKGFPTYQDQLAFEDQRARELQQWQWNNDPSYRKPSAPSPWSSALGQIGGMAAGGFIGSLF